MIGTTGKTRKCVFKDLIGYFWFYCNNKEETRNKQYVCGQEGCQKPVFGTSI